MLFFVFDFGKDSLVMVISDNHSHWEVKKWNTC